MKDPKEAMSKEKTLNVTRTKMVTFFNKKIQALKHSKNKKKLRRNRTNLKKRRKTMLNRVKVWKKPPSRRSRDSLRNTILTVLSWYTL
jgi:hypothetical protein